jgi:hypothetical protein
MSVLQRIRDDAMARKRKSEAEGKPKRMGRPPLESGAKTDTFTLRTGPEWKEWLGRFALFCRREKSELIDDALEAYAKRRGFEPPPKR